jgi:hypothetical protein
MNKGKKKAENKVEVLLRDLLITSLAGAGVKQAEIRRIAGCSMNDVSRIAKHIERGR